MNRWAFLAVGLVMGLVAGLLIPRQAPTAPALTVTDGERYFVERVVDGDTIHLKIGIRVRYIAVDTPEMGKYEKNPQPGAEEATEVNRRLVEKKWVRLKLGPRVRDLYGRVLARVLVEENGKEIDVGMQLLREGMGRAISREYNEVNYTEAKREEEEAHAAGRGNWADK